MDRILYGRRNLKKAFHTPESTDITNSEVIINSISSIDMATVSLITATINLNKSDDIIGMIEDSDISTDNFRYNFTRYNKEYVE